MHNLYLLENKIAQDLPLVEDHGIATPTQIIFLEKENPTLNQGNRKLEPRIGVHRSCWIVEF